MAIEVPKIKASESIQRSQRRIPVEQLIQTLSYNPAADAIQTGGNVLAGALQKRAELRRQAAESAALQQFAETGKIPAGAQIRPELLDKGASLYRAMHPVSYVPMGRDEQGNIIYGDALAPNQRPYNVDGGGHTPALQQRQAQWQEEQWQKLTSRVNALNASSRKALGQAGGNNLRAQRLLATAQNPNATPQDVQNMIADLQGVYKGGVPDETMLKYGNYNTIKLSAANALTMLTGNPSSAHSPQVVAHLVQLARELQNVDNKAIRDNFGVESIGFEGIRRNDPQRWQRLVDSMQQAMPTDSGGAATAPAGGKPGELSPAAQALIKKHAEQ